MEEIKMIDMVMKIGEKMKSIGDSKLNRVRRNGDGRLERIEVKSKKMEIGIIVEWEREGIKSIEGRDMDMEKEKKGKRKVIRIEGMVENEMNVEIEKRRSMKEKEKKREIGKDGMVRMIGKERSEIRMVEKIGKLGKWEIEESCVDIGNIVGNKLKIKMMGVNECGGNSKGFNGE